MSWGTPARAEDHADFLELANGMRLSSRITIIPLSSELLDRGMELMRKRSDKDWSLTDCTSFILMEDEDIRDALTADRNFEQAGFKALFR